MTIPSAEFPLRMFKSSKPTCCSTLAKLNCLHLARAPRAPVRAPDNPMPLRKKNHWIPVTSSIALNNPIQVRELKNNLIQGREAKNNPIQGRKLKNNPIQVREPKLRSPPSSLIAPSNPIQVQVPSQRIP